LSSDIIATLGSRGMCLFSEKGQGNLIPTVAKEVYDVTGAGDSVISAVALALGSGSSVEEAMVLGNYCAGIAVSKKGTYQVTNQDLLLTLERGNGKLKSLSTLESICQNLKENGKKIVFTNGCYDLLHPGHIALLEQAKSYGDILVLGVNGDNSPFFKTKGSDRPILNESDRVKVLSSIVHVDYITLFQEDTPMGILRKIKPDVKVKGGSYIPDRANEEDEFVKSYGGECVYLDMQGQYSTTSLIKKIREPNK